MRMHVRPTPEVLGYAFRPLHSGLALVVVEAAFPLLPHFALTVVTDHRERAQRGCMVPDPLLADRRARIHDRFHLDHVNLGHQLHPRAPVLHTALAAAGLMDPVGVVEVGAVMRTGEHRALANELEVAPGQQRVTRHPVLGDEESVARELWLEALVNGVAAHALGGWLIDVIAWKLALI